LAITSGLVYSHGLDPLAQQFHIRPLLFSWLPSVHGLLPRAIQNKNVSTDL
jgi:hypothetical protein